MGLQRRTCLPLLIMTGLSAAAVADEAQRAERIVNASGVTAGLCVQVDGEDGKLAYAAGRSGRLLVHALARPGNVGAARKRVRSAGLYGRVSVGEAATFARLPYADNLVNLLIVEDLPRATRRGWPRRRCCACWRPGAWPCSGRASWTRPV